MPDRLKRLWWMVEGKQLAVEDYQREHERLIEECSGEWSDALRLEGIDSLQESIVLEIGSYCGNEDLLGIREECRGALAGVKREWQSRVGDVNPQSVERFYNQSEAMLFELIWWHSLTEDLSPLAYVVALHFAEEHSCRDCLDFGSGVGSGGLLFARHALTVTLADISSPALAFSRWRFHKRGLEATHLDLKQTSLPHAAYDLVVAMDVFEHLVEPVRAVETLWRALRPGGFLFGRFQAEADDDRPHHITLDFGATLKRMEELGFTEVWRDEWLWGHQAFQRR